MITEISKLSINRKPFKKRAPPMPPAKATTFIGALTGTIIE
jgi:hypothetical protein